MSDDLMTQAVSRYASRVHQLCGDEHHVVSPLGAWLLLALCAPLAVGPLRSELADALGIDPAFAADHAAALIDNSHRVIDSGVAVWNRPQVDTQEVVAWRDALPLAAETGDVPSPAALDEWATARTRGLIRRFPVEVKPEDVIVLASALATKVSWDVPFALAPVAALGGSSRWATSVDQVLAAPRDPRHDQFVAETAQAGIVIVHTVRAQGGLRVISVAAGPDVPTADVLDAAYDVACTEAIRPGRNQRVSLFDLPVGEGPMWLIQEDEVETSAANGLEEQCRAILPAWSAGTQMDLSPDGLGFPSAAGALAEALHLQNFGFRAGQSAVATYSRIGFEAAAVTSFAVATSAPRMVQGLRRTAELRFGHPFAVVAVAVDDDPLGFVRKADYGPWHGMPVFSAWVAEPAEAGGQE